MDGPAEGFNNAISVQPTFSTKIDFKHTDGKEALQKIIGVPKQDTAIEPRHSKKRGTSIPVIKEQLGSLGYRKKKKKAGEKGGGLVGFEFVGGVTMLNKRHDLAKPLVLSTGRSP